MCGKLELGSSMGRDAESHLEPVCPPKVVWLDQKLAQKLAIASSSKTCWGRECDHQVRPHKPEEGICRIMKALLLNLKSEV